MMKERSLGWMKEWMNKQKNKRMPEWKNECNKEWKFQRSKEWMKEGRKYWLKVKIKEGMCEWKYEWENVCKWMSEGMNKIMNDWGMENVWESECMIKTG